MSVNRWRRALAAGGRAALASKGGRAARGASSLPPGRASWRRCRTRARRRPAMRIGAGCWPGSRSGPGGGSGGVRAGRDGCAAAPARLERAGPGLPRGRAGRGQDRQVAGGDLAGGKRTAADLGAWLVVGDESGRGPRPPEGRTGGRRGQTPVVRVTGGHGTRVPLAALIAARPRCPARLIYRTHRGHRGGRREGFTEADCARLPDAARRQPGGPLVVVRDGLGTHVSRAMGELAAARSWLRVCRVPPYASELNPAEPAWPDLKRSLASLATHGTGQLTALVKTRLRRMRYRPGLLGGFLAKTGPGLGNFHN